MVTEDAQSLFLEKNIFTTRDNFLLNFMRVGILFYFLITQIMVIFFASACYFLSIWSEIKINGHHNAETRFAFTNKVQYFRATLKIKSVETLCKLGFRSC